MISQDLPIKESADDTLNRSSFAKSLAQTIAKYSCESSFSIGLYGEWGSGKTSILNMVLEAIEEIEEGIIILRFNPWLCSDPKQLITQFFKQLASAIQLKKPKAEQAWKLIDQYADIIESANLIPAVGSYLAAAGKLLTRKAKVKVEQQTGNLQKSKDQIIRKMTEEDLKIVVSIDDIDRLSEEEIVAVFQLVKSLADFPNTVYILAFDYNVVVRALGTIQHGDGKEYLEKIIQVPFEIPAASPTAIHNALFSKLNTILGNISEEKWDKATWVDLFQFGIKPYVKTIRDVIRFTNVFSLKYELLQYDTDPIDLLGLTCLQVFEPNIYSKLPAYKNELCGSDHSWSYERQKTEEEKLKTIVTSLFMDGGTSTNLEAAKHILGILFPKTKSQVGISFSIGRQYSHSDCIVNNNVATSECFDRYFALVLENDAIPTSMINHLIFEASETDFSKGMLQIYYEGKIVRLLEMIAAIAGKTYYNIIPNDRASLIIKCLARNWSVMEVEEKGFLSVPFEWRLIFCVDPLLKIMSKESAYPCIRSVFLDHDIQPSTLSLLLHDFENQLGRFGTDSEPQKDAIFSLEQIEELECIFRTRAEEAVRSGAALQSYKGLDFLWLLGQIDASLAANIRKSIVSDDISLVKVLSHCTSCGTVATKFVIKTRSINRHALEDFINIDEAYRRTKDFINTCAFATLSKNDQMNAIAFILIIENDSSDSIMKDCIAEDTILKKMDHLFCHAKQ